MLHQFSLNDELAISDVITLPSCTEASAFENETWSNFDDESSSLVELSKSAKVFGNHFTRGCKWSPDGLCVLINCSDNHLRLFDLPSKISDDEMPVALSMRQGQAIYDFCWFPLMNSSQVSTCCIASTGQNQPIHLFDAYNGHIRATYRCFNNVDEVTSALSLCFAPSGEFLYAGLKSEIRIFRTDRPGRDCLTRHTFCKNKKSQYESGGLAGIVSCIDINSFNDKIYAAGTFRKRVGVFVEPTGDALCYLDGQIGGVTHIKFSFDGTKLFTGGRMDDEIFCWDLRSLGRKLFVLKRHVRTNQRIYFDLDPSGKFLASGNTNGQLSIWNLSKQGGDIYPKEFGDRRINLHGDCINGVSFHPFWPYLATCSGQRHFSLFVDSDDEDSNAESTGFDYSLKILKHCTKTHEI